MFELGWLLHNRGDFAEAEQRYRRAAEAGNASGMSNLGRLLHDRVATQGRLQRWRHRARNGDELVEAELWLRKAAAAGDANAMAGLGALFEEHGDFSEAERWYREAISAGSTDAMNNMGMLLEKRGESPRPSAGIAKPQDSVAPPRLKTGVD